MQAIQHKMPQHEKQRNAKEDESKICRELTESPGSVGQPWPSEQEVGEQPEAVRTKIQA